MQQQAVETSLTRAELQALRNKRTGLAIFQVSWIMAFVCLIFVNIMLRGRAESWPPPGVDHLNAAVPTLMTLGLIASSLFARRGVRAIRLEDRASFLSNWRVTMALAALFVVAMTVEWLTVPVSGQYSNVFRLMVGFHGVHALVIGLILVRVYRSGTAGEYDARHFWPVEGSAGLWYFVTIAWLLFYAVLYLI